MKHDPEGKTFLDRNRYISQENSNTACRIGWQNTDKSRTTDSRMVMKICTKYGQVMDNDTDESRKYGMLQINSTNAIQVTTCPLSTSIWMKYLVGERRII